MAFHGSFSPPLLSSRASISSALSNTEGGGNFGKGRFLGVANLNPANAEQAATLARGFGGTLADLTKPALEGCNSPGAFAANTAENWRRASIDLGLTSAGWLLAH